MDQFLPSHQNYAQNSTRNPKLMVLKTLVKKWQKIARFRALKSIFEFNVFKGYFCMLQGFKKATPYGCAWKLRLTRPSVSLVKRSEAGRKVSYYINILTNITDNRSRFQILYKFFDSRPSPIPIIGHMLRDLFINIMDVCFFNSYRSGFAFFSLSLFWIRSFF